MAPKAKAKKRTQAKKDADETEEKTTTQETVEAGEQLEETPEPITLTDVKESFADAGERVIDAGLDPFKDVLGGIARKVFRGVGAFLDEIDDRGSKK